MPCDVILLNGDFDAVVHKMVKPGEFVYLDPPYAIENQRIFTQYCNHTFGLNDIARLNETICHINRIGAYFLLSYAYTEKIKSVFKCWSIREVSVQRNIAGFSNQQPRHPSDLRYQTR